jgi:hypothetical protein
MVNARHSIGGRRALEKDKFWIPFPCGYGFFENLMFVPIFKHFA